MTQSKDKLMRTRKPVDSFSRALIATVGKDGAFIALGWPSGAPLTEEEAVNLREHLDEYLDRFLARFAPSAAAIMRFEDPKDPYNSDLYWTGKACIKKGCKKPAGTWWSRLWCFDHNAERMRQINKTRA